MVLNPEALNNVCGCIRKTPYFIYLCNLGLVELVCRLLYESGRTKHCDSQEEGRVHEMLRSQPHSAQFCIVQSCDHEQGIVVHCYHF